MKKLVTVLALIVCAVLPAVASANFRDDNYWQQTPANAQHALVGNYRLWGPETNFQKLTVQWAKCKGDLDYTHNSRGWYHHLWCAVVLKNSPNYFAHFELWQIGPHKSNFRVTNIEFLRFDS